MTDGKNKTSKKDVTPNPNIQAVNQIISSEKKSRINATVEKTAIIPQRQETFITQRGGKIRTLQSTLLLQKKKEMQQVQQQLEKRRLDFSKRMEECREKQDELRSKQKQIKERVAKFEKFLKENDAKRLRANAKAVVEKKLREQKEAELAAIQRQLQVELGKSKSILKLISIIQLILEQHQGYERYLQSIVDVLPPDYLNVHEPQINDILMRYKTLVETNQDLISVVQHNQDDIEKAQSTLLGLVKERNDLIMVYNSKLGMRQKTLDKLKQESAYLEEGLEERDNTGKERLRMLSETKLAIDDLYERIKDQNKMRVLTARKIEPDQSESSGDFMSKSTDLKSWLDKLHALQFRVLDLQDITQFDKGVNNVRKAVK
ncbi:Coiled-coil domain-containing protein 42 [Boothiomyces sp. JEL0866]|nr:Coiled-coil domain-containing protein 42 [Boothiomyces sp. JEL0866]